MDSVANCITFLFLTISRGILVPITLSSDFGKGPDLAIRIVPNFCDDLAIGPDFDVKCMKFVSGWTRMRWDVGFVIFEGRGRSETYCPKSRQILAYMIVITRVIRPTL